MEIITLKSSNRGPVILWGMFPHRGDEPESLVKAVENLVGKEDYTLIAFCVNDWNSEFSPWRVDCEAGNFAGEGKATLTFIEKEMIPAVYTGYGKDRPIYIMGYSLAGLFALWALFESDVFAGAMSCSGSLWYPGFLDYVSDKRNIGKEPVKKIIYISLGGKEKNSSNKLLSTIEDCSKKFESLFKNTAQIKYEVNQGGHFANPEKRLAKAVKWILDVEKKQMR